MEGKGKDKRRGNPGEGREGFEALDAESLFWLSCIDFGADPFYFLLF